MSNRKQFTLTAAGLQYVLTIVYLDGHVEALVLTPHELDALRAAVEPPTH